ncbi:MAG: nucleotide pyrophosphohydrolase [Alphaproteobacteria bacterium]|nr:MAG: nucleotide pyrophosphohydrolase [Alphaproteobacteria bacterium]
MPKSLKDLSERAAEIRDRFKMHELKKYGRAWSAKDVMLGMVGDVGDLAKLVLAQDGIRDIPDKHKKLEHELSDCLWSFLVLAKEYDVDLERTFLHTMDEIEKKLK